MYKQEKMKNNTPIIIAIAVILLFMSFYVVWAELDDEEYGEESEREYYAEQARPETEDDNTAYDQAPAAPAAAVPEVLPAPTAAMPDASVPAAGVNSDTVQAISQRYADSDGDGIPDSIDKYPGEDDFAYAIIDKNGNGIADELEIIYP